MLQLHGNCQESMYMNNPYSAPLHGLAPIQSESAGAVVQGNLLKIKTGFVFPENCVLCGENCSGHMKKKKLYYAPVWMWIFILLNLLVLAIVYFIVRKPLDITFGYCEQHRSKKRIYGIISHVSFIVGVGFAILAGVLAAQILAIVTPILIIASLIFLVLNNRTITVVGHNKGEFTIKKVSPAVLDIILARNP